MVPEQPGFNKAKGDALRAETSFLNADLIIRSHYNLHNFAKELEQRGLMMLHVFETKDSLWQATFELDSESGEDNFHTIMDGMLKCIEALPILLKKQWDELQQRILDMGFEMGADTRYYTRQISPELLSRVISADLALAITLYLSTDND